MRGYGLFNSGRIFILITGIHQIIFIIKKSPYEQSLISHRSHPNHRLGVGRICVQRSRSYPYFDCIGYCGIAAGDYPSGLSQLMVDS
jgi:hypothetical protein